MLVGVTMDDDCSVLPEQIGFPLCTCWVVFRFTAPFLVGDMVCMFFFGVIFEEKNNNDATMRRDFFENTGNKKLCNTGVRKHT